MSDVFRIALPASSANLGPCFDAAAIAWNRRLRVEARVADAFRVRASGRDAETCGRVQDHLILQVYAGVMQRAGVAAPPLALELDNEIPLGKGCGSSAAARLAGVALAAHFGGLAWTSGRVLEEAARLEGHPDNVAACWWGGLVVAQAQAGAQLRWLQAQGAARWPLLVVVPQQALATERARAVLPETYSRADAIANVQNAMLLLGAWQQGRRDLLAAAMADRMHQPYRAPLCPLLGALLPLAGSHGVLGCCLSGAGPSVLVVTEDVASATAAVEGTLRQAALEAEILPVMAVTEGPGQTWGKP